MKSKKTHFGDKQQVTFVALLQTVAVPTSGVMPLLDVIFCFKKPYWCAGVLSKGCFLRSGPLPSSFTHTPNQPDFFFFFFHGVLSPYDRRSCITIPMQKIQELQQRRLLPLPNSGSPILTCSCPFYTQDHDQHFVRLAALSLQQATALRTHTLMLDCSRLSSSYKSTASLFSQIGFLGMLFPSPVPTPLKPLQNTPFWLLKILVSSSFCRLKDFWAGWQI